MKSDNNCAHDQVSEEIVNASKVSERGERMNIIFENHRKMALIVWPRVVLQFDNLHCESE